MHRANHARSVLIAGGLAVQQPDLAADILWGAAALVATDAAWSEHLLAAFAQDETALLDRAPVASA